MHKIGDIAKGKPCPVCDRIGTMQFVERLIEDGGLGQDFRGPAERVQFWRCRACKYEPDASFDPGVE